MWSIGLFLFDPQVTVPSSLTRCWHGGRSLMATLELVSSCCWIPITLTSGCGSYGISAMISWPYRLVASRPLETRRKVGESTLATSLQTGSLITARRSQTLTGAILTGRCGRCTACPAAGRTSCSIYPLVRTLSPTGTPASHASHDLCWRSLTSPVWAWALCAA